MEFKLEFFPRKFDEDRTESLRKRGPSSSGTQKVIDTWVPLMNSVLSNHILIQLVIAALSIVNMIKRYGIYRVQHKRVSDSDAKCSYGFGSSEASRINDGIRIEKKRMILDGASVPATNHDCTLKVQSQCENFIFPFELSFDILRFIHGYVLICVCR